MGKTAVKRDEQTALELSAELSSFIENMGLFYEGYGVPRIGGRILGLMLVTKEEVSAEQIASALKVSRSSVSTNIRMLTTIQLIEKVVNLGDRIDYYIFSPQGWEHAISMRAQGLLPLKKLAKQGLAALPPKDAARVHLNEMIEWADLSRKYYDMMLEEWRSRHKS